MIVQTFFCDVREHNFLPERVKITKEMLSLFFSVVKKIMNLLKNDKYVIIVSEFL